MSEYIDHLKMLSQYTYLMHFGSSCPGCDGDISMVAATALFIDESKQYPTVAYSVCKKCADTVMKGGLVAQSVADHVEMILKPWCEKRNLKGGMEFNRKAVMRSRE
jgi:hypothetical protein